jgi:hypothetical protein
MSAQLSKLWDEGLTCSQIAERLGVTKNAVVGKVRRMKLRPRRASTGNRVSHVHREEVPDAIDWNRADKLLRRFSWEDAA